MSKSIRMCGVQAAYLDYLRQFDHKVSLDLKQNRKFIGILLEIGEHFYYAPLSSPKPRHASISEKAPDLYKIQGGTLGVINLNNMIPVPSSVLISIDISTIQDIQYQQLLTKQMVEIRKNEEAIKKKARRLYQIIKSGKQPYLHTRCCDYARLEEMSLHFGTVLPVAKQEIAAGAHHVPHADHVESVTWLKGKE